MAEDHASHTTRPAGSVTAWMREVQAALGGEADADVACDGCTACCTASQFVPVGPDETDTLAHIPSELLFAAPRMPPGHVVLGYDEHGRCPMLIDDRCSIYAHRPRTCRTYDCRVFPASGIEVDGDDPDKAAIGRRARRWRFTHPTPADQVAHDAVQAAGRFVTEHPEVVSPGGAPVPATARAVLAVEVHRAFLAADHGSGGPTLLEHPPGPQAVRVELHRRRRDDPDG